MLAKIIKVVSVSLFLSLLFGVCVSAAPTNLRVATEFCELAMSRADRLKYSGLDFDIKPGTSMVFPSFDGKTKSITTAVASIYVDPDDFTIHEANMILSRPGETEEEGNNNFAKCAIAISALEFNSTDDDLYSIAGDLLYESESTTDESFKILNDSIILSDGSNAFTKAMETGEDILIYSGNYDYYVRYYDMEEYQALAVIALERQQ